MKFSYRLVALFVFSFTASVTFFLWTNNLYRFGNLENLSKTATEPNNLHYNDKNNIPTRLNNSLYKKKGGSIFQSSDRVYDLACENLETNGNTKSDLNTYDLLHTIDSIYNIEWTKDEEVAKKKIGEKFSIVKPSKGKGNERPLKVIVLPHSHSDPGWLKTVANYFEDQTQHTLDNMLEKLTKYPDMTFIWAETVFFSMWWDELDSEDKSMVKKLIDRNQLEIAVGSWVVPDEANPNLFGLINQMIEGHQWLQHRLDVKPRHTWSLDVFGYTSSLPYLYKRAGFDHMIILRTHQFLKHYMQNSQNLDFFWRQVWDDTGRNDMFTTMLPYALYNIKHQCGPDQGVCLMFDFRKIPMEYSEADAQPVTDTNVAHLSKKLLKQFRLKNQLYKHDVVLMPIGDDFRFDRSIEWDQQYGNYSKLFQYMNTNKEMNVEIGFGTLNDYVEAVNKNVEKNKVSIPTLQGDFFPYTDRSEEYWTGYFTSRAYDKNYGREVEHYLRAAEILNVLAKARGGDFKHYSSNIEALTIARQASALFQHHDAITGTSRQYVVIDFEQRLLEAMRACEGVITTSSQYLIATEKSLSETLKFEMQQPYSMALLRPSKTTIDTSKGHATIVVLNPSTQPRQDVVRISIDSDNVDVYDSNDHLVLSQINPLWISHKEMYRNLFELVFIADLAPLSLNRYRVIVVPKTEKPKENIAAYLSFSNAPQPKVDTNMRFKTVPPRSETIQLENGYLRARFSARSGLLQSITTKAKLSTTSVFTENLMYKSRRSGAYIFEPTGPATDTEMYNTPPITVVKGPVLSEIRVTQRNSVVTQIIRIYNCTGILGSVLEINNIANLTSMDEHELVMRLTAHDLKTEKGVFFTDLNGFHTIKRKRFANFPRQANYYPMTSHAYIEDAEKRLSILSAQPLGVSSQEDNSLEVMLDRRLLYDDMRGLGEGLRDTKITPSQFYLLLESKSDVESSQPENRCSSCIASYPSLQAHLLSNQLQHRLIIMSTTSNHEHVQNAYEPIKETLPCDMTLINLRALSTPPKDLSMSRRVASSASAAMVVHKFGIDCSFPTLGFQCETQNHGVVPEQIFTDAKISAIKEMTLSLLHERRDVYLNETLHHDPMEIYTYQLSFS